MISNHNVIALIRGNSDFYQSNNSSIKVIKSDLSELDKIKDELDRLDIEIIYHLAWAGSSGVMKSSSEIQFSNIINTIKLYNLSKKLNVKKIIITGTISENLVTLDNDEISLYSYSKYFTRLTLNNISLNDSPKITWIQLANLFGTSDKSQNLISMTINKLFNNQEAEYSKAEHLYDFLVVEEAARALSKLAEKVASKDIYYLGSGNPMPLRDFLFEIAGKLNKTELLKFGEKRIPEHIYLKDWFDSSHFFNDFDFQIKKTFSKAINEVIEYKKNNNDLIF